MTHGKVNKENIQYTKPSDYLHARTKPIKKTSCVENREYDNQLQESIKIQIALISSSLSKD